MEFKLVKGKHPLSIHAVWLPIILGLVIFSQLMPTGTCVFHHVTGVPCLTCGVSRAVSSLLSGDIVGMLYFNPLVVLFSAGLVFFSLFKLLEFILSFRLKMRVGRKSALILRIFAVTMIAANWAFLIATGR